MLTQLNTVEIATPTGSMQTQIVAPTEKGQYPAIVFYSEIFQITGPILRSARMMAGLGFIVLVPEVFHELNPMGTVLAYDDIGKDKGNSDKFAKPLENHDSDLHSIHTHLHTQPNWNGNLGAMGVCIGGHLAFRAAIHSVVNSAFCLYPTDIHSNTLPCQEGNDSLSRAKDITGEVFVVVGKQDPHVPLAGRQQLLQHFQAINLNYHWLEVNAQHAFMRDEGERYDAELALEMYQKARDFFRRTLNV